MTDIYKRAASLIVANDAEAIDLSELRFKFTIETMDVQSPNTCTVRVYNLSDTTAKKVSDQFTKLVVQAGYENSTKDQTIFVGTIKQFRRGKERNVDSFLDIMAADGDIGYNFGTLNRTLAAPSTSLLNRLDVAGLAVAGKVDENAKNGVIGIGGILPRGKVMFGLARAFIEQIAHTHGFRWSIQNGVLQMTELEGVIPGDPIEVNSETGMVGVPQATAGGIDVVTLLNPEYRVGRRVKINNRDITSSSFAKTTINGKVVDDRFGFPDWTSIALPATTSDDGIYRILAIRYVGDTRGHEWYSFLTCLSVFPNDANDFVKVRAA